MQSKKTTPNKKETKTRQDYQHLRKAEKSEKENSV
jgi:hypothetical protein